MSLDNVTVAIRTALIEGAGIGDQLSEFNGEPAIFTRRPIPGNAPVKHCIVNPPTAVGDNDGLNSPRPYVMIDIAFYGKKGQPGSSNDQTREVEAMAFASYVLFHRERFSVQPDGFSVTSIVATGPVVAPVDDQATVGRVVTLTIQLRRLGT